MRRAVAADAGASSAWALVEAPPRGRPKLLHLAEVHGVGWHELAFAGAREIVAIAGIVPAWVEVPHSVVHRGSGMAHHATGTALGRRIGKLEAAWFAASGVWPGEVLPGSKEGQWWRPFALGKKTGDGAAFGLHRVAEAALYVEGARERLALVRSAERRVDCAEAILAAGAMALGLPG